MYEGKTVAVVVPAYNEEEQIGMVIETMPQFVDRIVVVNDCSKDRTHEVICSYINKENNIEDEILISPKSTPRYSSVYDRANAILEEMREQEESYYVEHKVYNDNELDRIVLLENLCRGG